MVICKGRGRQAGFTLTELSLVAALGALVVGFVLTVVPGLIGAAKVHGEIGDVTSTVAKIQRFYTNKPNYAGVTQPLVIRLKLVPAANLTGMSIANRWNGLTSISLFAPGISTANDAMTYATTSVPSAECVQLALGLEHTMKIIQVGTGGAAVVKANGAPLDIDKLASQCSAASVATLVFTFGK